MSRKQRPKSPPKPGVEELNDDERDHLMACMARFVELVDVDAKLKPGKGEDTPELADRVVRWWHKLPKSKRPDANEMVLAIGIAVGNFLQDFFDLDWKVITDDFGTAICLYSPGKGDMEHVIVSPVDSVAKRFGTSPDGFVCEYLAGVFESLKPLSKSN